MWLVRVVAGSSPLSKWSMIRSLTLAYGKKIWLREINPSRSSNTITRGETLGNKKKTIEEYKPINMRSFQIDWKIRKLGKQA